MNHSTAALAAVVRDALNVSGHLTPSGALTRAAADQLPQLSRATVSRHIATGDFTATELYSLATLLGTTPTALMAQAEERAA